MYLHLVDLDGAKEGQPINGASVRRIVAAAGVPAGPVNDIAGAVALAQRLGLDPVTWIERPDGSPVALMRNPISLSATPPAYRSAPPTLGADTERVLADILSRGRALPAIPRSLE